MSTLALIKRTSLGLVLAMTACASGQSERTPIADAIYLNGNIWTGGSDSAGTEAIAIADGTILMTGSSLDANRYKGSETRIVDLDGARVVPGFSDSHTHFIPGGFSLGEIQLRDATTKEEFVRRIQEKAESLPKGAWVMGGSWDHELWGGELPNREWIDAVTPDNPVYVVRYAGHMSLSNSLALRLAGVDALTPVPAGGEITRDTSGQPTGVMKDAAQELIEAVIPEPSHAQLDAAFDQAQAAALSYGVTQIHDVNNWQSFETFLRARDRGALKMRVYSMTELENGKWQRMADYVSEHGRGDDWLRWGGVKGYVDGALGASTAWFYEPYKDSPQTSGFARYAPEDVRQWIKSADAAGLQVVVHAIGDKANDILLDTFEVVAEENGARDRRFRIEHAQHLSGDAFSRFAELGIIASMQPYHAIDDGRWAEKRIGPDRIKRTYAFRSLLDTGAILTFGSDWFVAPLDPLTGIYAAVTRKTLDDANPNGWIPAEKITVEEALRAYTVTPAYAGFQEDKLGTIEPGKLADFVVLSDDLLNLPSEQLKSIRVVRTVVGGEDKFIAGE